jgi:hypothetical protein
MIGLLPSPPSRQQVVFFSVFLCDAVDLTGGGGGGGKQIMRDPERLALSKSLILSESSVQRLHERRGIRQGHGRPQHGLPLELLGSTEQGFTNHVNKKSRVEEENKYQGIVNGEFHTSNQIRISCTGVKASFKVGLNGGMTHTPL